MLRQVAKKLLPEKWQPYRRLRTLVEEGTRGTVVAGPFRGLRMPDDSAFGVYFPKLLGTYELELHDLMKGLVGSPYRTVIDIGAAEGYYACGLARLMPGAKVIAFEVTLRGRYLLEETIARNDLGERVAVRGLCELPQLRECFDHAQPPCFILCDAEGYEYELLDPAQVPGLRTATLLVEVHDFMLAGVSEKLKQRFLATHVVEAIHPRPRTRADFPLPMDGVKRVADRHFFTFMADDRPQANFWLWMRPRMANGAVAQAGRSSAGN
jgi:predicted O-methyltransferase YrrM